MTERAIGDIVKFDGEYDAVILYYIPSEGITLPWLLEYLFLLERIAPPKYDCFRTCIEKAISIGMLQRRSGEFQLNDDWHSRIHEFDTSDEPTFNFEKYLRSKSWPVITTASLDISESDYNKIARQVNHI